MVRVLFFGRLRDLAGVAEIEIAAGARALPELRAQLSAGNPSLSEALSAPSVRVAIDQSIVQHDASISNAREIAFMPPLSGG